MKKSYQIFDLRIEENPCLIFKVDMFIHPLLSVGIEENPCLAFRVEMWIHLLLSMEKLPKIAQVWKRVDI